MRNQFLTLLLGDKNTCFADSPYGTAIKTGPGPQDVFFSINPMHTSRKDAHVEEFRNFLIEFDGMPLEQQVPFMQNSGVPISTAVFSGSKSYHFIISLEEPLLNIDEYRSVADRLLEKFTDADSACRNPSRLSRLPGVVRPDTGKDQSLLYIGDRVSLSLLQQILPEQQIKFQPVNNPKFLGSRLVNAIMFPEKTMNDLGVAGRNHYFFWLGQRLLEAGLQRDLREQKVKTAYSKLKNKTGFSLREAMQAARV